AAADIDDDRRTQLTQLRQLLLDESVHADALQADRIEHAGGGFDDALGRVALARLEKETFDGDAAERREVDRLGVLAAVPKTSARRDQRVLERQRPDLD